MTKVVVVTPVRVLSDGQLGHSEIVLLSGRLGPFDSTTDIGDFLNAYGTKRISELGVSRWGKAANAPAKTTARDGAKKSVD